LNTTAHNLFTPINGLIGMSHLIEKEVQGNELAMKYMGMVNSCLQNLVFTVHNIMELSKIRLNNFKSFPKPINIEEKLNTLTEIFED
jgi:signal transduction histidine kinase